MKTGEIEQELLTLEKAFAEAIVRNDLEGIGRLVTDDWIVIDPNGEIVDRVRFFEVIKSGALTHDMMESEDFRVRVYGDSAVVTGLTRTAGTYSLRWQIVRGPLSAASGILNEG